MRTALTVFMDLRLHYNTAVFLFISLFCTTVLAQRIETAADQLQREGRYVNVTLQLGDPIKIFISGKERARFSLADLKLEIKTLSNDGWEEIRINKYGNYYSIGASQDKTPSGILEVRTTLKNKKTESFKFKLN